MTAVAPAPCDTVTAAAVPCQGNPHPTATLAAAILGSSLAFIDGSVVNVALPAIAQDLGAGAADLSWTINAYLLPLGALILLGGASGDRFGRRRLFIGGIGLFLAASLLCAAAASLDVLLLGRALQGIGAAALMPNSLALLGAGFSGEARGRAIGTWAGVGALAAALGPLLGGWLVGAVGWRSIFLLNLPIGLAAMWLAGTYLSESREQRHGGRLDWVGAAAVTAGLTLLTWGLTAAAAPSEATAGSVPAALAMGALLLAAFLWWELRRGKEALMPLYLMRTPTFVGVTLLTFLLYAALGGLLVLLPYLLIRVQGYSPLAAGAALLPLPLLIGAGSRLMGQLTARIGGRWPLAMGSLIVAVGFALFLRVGMVGAGYWHDVFPATLVVGLGLAVTVAPLTTTVMAAVDAGHVGVASGFNSAVARIGGLIATALLGFVFVEQVSSSAFTASFHLAALAGAGLAAAAGLAALALIGPRPAVAATADQLG